jgi:hypothetical protein
MIGKDKKEKLFAEIEIVVDNLDKVKPPKRYDLDYLRKETFNGLLPDDMVVLHILENYTDFNKLRESFDKKDHTGNNVGYNIFLVDIFCKIKQVYPALSEACMRQLAMMLK